ncbi:MAG: flagellar protein FliT [Thiohalomonadaceae bacterium]
MSSITERRATLTALVSLSEQMLECARKGEWDAVPVLETQRREGLEAFFSNATLPEEAAFIEPALEGILEIDRQLIELATESREVAAAKLKDLQQGRRAQSAYNSNR